MSTPKDEDAFRLSINFKITQRQWFAEADKMDPLDPLKHQVANNTWLTPPEVKEYGDKWHLLPLTLHYTVPQTIDPAVRYNNRSHSMNRSEVLQYVRDHPDRKIPLVRPADCLGNSTSERERVFTNSQLRWT